MLCIEVIESYRNNETYNLPSSEVKLYRSVMYVYVTKTKRTIQMLKFSQVILLLFVIILLKTRNKLFNRLIKQY